jgi:hypothetical protein
VKVVAFDASVRLVAYVVASSVSLNRCRMAAVAVAAEAVNGAGNVATAAAAADVVEIEPTHLADYAAVPVPSSQVKMLVSSCTGYPSWSNACMASPPRTSNAGRHTLHMLVRHGCAE